MSALVFECYNKLAHVLEKLIVQANYICEQSQNLSDEDFIAELKKLNASFHNFAALDSRCKHFGLDMNEDMVLVEKLKQYEVLNQALYKIVELRKNRASKDLKVIQEGRRALSKFRSGAEEITDRFVNRV